MAVAVNTMCAAVVGGPQGVRVECVGEVASS